MSTLTPNSQLLDLLKRHWGYDDFRPLQADAVNAVVDHRDSLVILPTGGGKSICYQLPALAMPGMAVIISPLISLIKDQVDGLKANGIEAAAINTAMSAEERRATWQGIREGRVKLLYLAPEALVREKGEPNEQLLEALQDTQLSFIAIDEAHCISQWGHEYRPAYRGLGSLRRWFPKVALHAFTATATEAVREDIVESLGMRDAQVLVGSFDRPNLTYRTAYRRDLMSQVKEVMGRHTGEAGIVYCISKAEVDNLAEALQKEGYRALPYHAGLSAEQRRLNQEAFSTEAIDVIVATVAFGMGIDRSNVRFVLHANMPKSIENYQQEAGRAGRDGLNAECVLLYSAGDAMTWRRIQGEAHTEYGRSAMRRINEVYTFCQAFACRHRYLVKYFGQDYAHDNCGACVVCLGEREALADSGQVVRQLLTAVQELRGRFGAQYVAQVLKGSKVAKIVSNRHDQLPCYGSLGAHEAGDLSDWLDQLAGQGLLERGEYQVLQLTDAGREMLDQGGEALLTKPRPTKKSGSSRTQAPVGGLEGPEEALFQELRRWRREQAHERGVPPYVIFNDEALIGLAKLRPATPAGLTGVKGIGQAKAAEYGESVVELLTRWCGENGLSLGASVAQTALPLAAQTPPPAPQAPPKVPESASGRTKGQTLRVTLEMHQSGKSASMIAEERGLAESTVLGHLAQCIEAGEIALDSVVPPDALAPIHTAFEALGSHESAMALMFLVPPGVDYGHINCALAELRRSGQAIESADEPATARLRWLAGLAKAPDPEERESLVRELEDPDPRVRALAAYAIAKVAPDEASEPLLPALQAEADPLAQAGLIRGLGVGRDPRAHLPLERMMAEAGWDEDVVALARRVARKLAGLSGAPEATPTVSAKAPAAKAPPPAPAAVPVQAPAPAPAPAAPQPAASSPSLAEALGAIQRVDAEGDDDMVLMALAEALTALGFQCQPDFPVADRGDGKPGRVAIVADKAPLRLAIELGKAMPSYKALYKLGQVPESTRVMVLRPTRFDHVPEFADALVVLGPTPRLRMRF
ncbi:MAG: DNA helicase RecQ [Candidatus Sericytochromatia bacterium]